VTINESLVAFAYLHGMKILIAPDKFKGSMTAPAVCESIILGLKKHNSSHELIAHPLADGGDGSIDILADYLPLSVVNCFATDPIGRKISTHYYLSENKAFIELALTSGLVLLAQNEQNPMETSTIGTGELILDALEKGAKEIYLFVGGSATNDGGIGIAHALGFRFLDKNGVLLMPIGKSLTQITQIDSTEVNIDFAQVKIYMLSDVANPLLGPNGAAQTYAPQKGALPQEVESLDKGLKHFSTLLRKQYGVELATLNGAAGGVSACLVGLLNAQIQSGVKKMMEWTGFEQKMKEADWVISGEGRLDEQSWDGKVVGEVVTLAQKQGKPVTLFVGNEELSQDKKCLVNDIVSILDYAANIADAISNGESYLRQIAATWIVKTS